MKATGNPEQQRWRVRMLALHGTMLIVPAFMLALHSRFCLSGAGFCVVKRVFGVECPACGVTRAAMALFHGDVAQAVRFHPAAPLIMALLGLMVGYFLTVVVAGIKGMEWRKEVRIYTGIEVLALASLLLGWIGKMAVS
jgi:hypothetical protein